MYPNQPDISKNKRGGKLAVKGRISKQNETFVYEIIKNRTKPDAYVTAYPNHAHWSKAAISTKANELFRTRVVQDFYHETLNALRTEEFAKAKWTKEEATLTLKEVIENNSNEVHRINMAYEEELDNFDDLLYRATTEKDIAEIRKTILQRKKYRRMSNTNNQAIIAAAAELNRMYGYNENNLTLDKTVTFVGMDEIKE